MRQKKTKRCHFETLEAKQLLAADGAHIVSDSFQVKQNSDSQTFDVLLNDQFDDDYAGERIITGVSRGSAGSRIEIAEDVKSLTFTVAADATGAEEFTYFVDGEHEANVTVNISVPLRDDHFEFAPDRMTYALDVLANDSFWDQYEGEKKITLIGASTRGALVEISADGQSLTYTREEHVYGRETITYVVDDTFPSTVQIEIQDPLSNNRLQLVKFDAPHTIEVIEDDPFWPGYSGPRKITHILDIPEGTAATIAENGTSIVFDPKDVVTRNHNVRYVVDGEFETTLNVLIENPVRNDSATVDANSRDFLIDVLDNDYYNDAFRYQTRHYIVDRVTSVTRSEAGGSVSISESGREVSYTPPTDFVGTDTFTYTADGKFEATVTMYVREGGTLSRDNLKVFQGTENNRLDVLANDFLGNGYTGERIITSVQQVEGADISITVDGKHILFTPTADQYSTTFTYEVDSKFETTATVRNEDIARHHSFEFNAPAEHNLRLVSAIPENYVDGEGVITAVSQPEYGRVTISANGKSVLLEPGNGNAYFDYTIDDKYTNSVHVRYPRRLSHDTFVTHQNSLTRSFDPLENDFSNGSNLRWGTYGGPRQISHVQVSDGEGSASISPNGKLIDFIPSQDFTGTATVRYVVDGYLESTATIHVPRLVRHDRLRAVPNSETGEKLDVLANDLVGGDYQGSLTITDVTAGVAGSQISISDGGKAINYIPADGFTGTDVFEYTVDGMLKAEVTVEVNATAGELYPKVDSLDAFKELVLAAKPNENGWYFGDFSLSANSDSAAPARDHSETNVQVDGVDEADLIETDSDHIYTLTQGQLVITQAWPADALQVLSRVDIPGDAVGQYLHGDRLTVISTDFLVPESDEPNTFYFQNSGKLATYITVLDVTDRAAPKTVQTTEIQGTHVQTRRIDDYVYLVVRKNDSLSPQSKLICDEDASCRSETEEERQTRIENTFESIVQEVLPTYKSFGPDGELVRSGLLVEPEDIYQPLSEGASTLVSVVTINIANSEPGLTKTSGVLTTDASDIYMSLKNLYVTENHNDWSDTSQDRFTTKLMKFELQSGTGDIQFTSSGQVPGRTLNQFSVDEFDGHVRVATSIANSHTGNFTGHDDNALFVLRDDAGILETVGTLPQMALDQSIRSVRFYGERAFVTTYNTIDPLFSIDLSDHTNPKIEGYLTLPGFATYTQFVDEHHVLTIGSASARGWGSLAISLFDVQDITQPVLVDQFRWDNTAFSPALTDHHAFGWFANHSTLAIPSQVNDTIRVDSDNDGYAEESVHTTDHLLHAFDIDTTLTSRNDAGIQLKGTMELDSKLLRSAYIDDKLYAIAEESIHSANMSTPSETIGKVDISNPVGPPERPVFFYATPIEDLALEAKLDLASRLSIGDDQVFSVATEVHGETTKLLLRAGDQQYLYNALDSRLTLERSDFRPVSVALQDWHNEAMPFDVTGDGEVSPRDALATIRAINEGFAGPLASQGVAHQLGLTTDAALDTNNDGFLSPRDVLGVINFLTEANRNAPPPPAQDTADLDEFFATQVDDDEEDAMAFLAD